MSGVNLNELAADIARRIDDLAQESLLNREQILINLLKPVFEQKGAEQSREERERFLFENQK